MKKTIFMSICIVLLGCKMGVMTTVQSTFSECSWCGIPFKRRTKLFFDRIPSLLLWEGAAVFCFGFSENQNGVGTVLFM